MFRFQDPLALLLLLAIPGLIYWYITRDTKKKGSIRYSDISIFKKIRNSPILYLRHLIPALRILAVAFVILALARPQSGRQLEDIATEGVDILLTVDVSGSMIATDVGGKNVRRHDISKTAMREFINNRKTDRIGLVAFAGNAFTQCPLTLDHGILLAFIDRLTLLMAKDDRNIEAMSKTRSLEDGTAIGTAIATGLNRLRDSKAKSRVMILVTDGANNRGEIDPLTAAKAAAALGIKIYTIGVGGDGNYMLPMETIFGLQYVPQRAEPIDEPMLDEIARLTQGRYFRGANQQELKQIYKTIDQLEKTEIHSKQYTKYTELFTIFLIPGLMLLGLEVILANTRFRRIP